MEIIEDFLGSSWSTPLGVVGVGTFDGVHVAHQRLISLVVARARELAHPSVVLTFEPLPMEVLQPGFTFRLGSLRSRLDAMARLEPSHAAIIRFDRGFAATEPRQFVEQVLVKRLGVREVCVGFNFTFGRGARGTPEMMESWGREIGFMTHILPPVTVDGKVVSSSAIRGMLSGGDVEGAARFLARPYVLEGTVVRGDGRGRRLGFPTANLEVTPPNAVVPGHGVYSGWARATGGVQKGCVINIGVNPTFGATREKVEVHLLDFSGDLAGQSLAVSFSRRLRRERAFASEEELLRQIRLDIQASLGPPEALTASPGREGARP